MVFLIKLTGLFIDPWLTCIFNNVNLKEVESHKHIGVISSSNLSWDLHIAVAVPTKCDMYQKRTQD